MLTPNFQEQIELDLDAVFFNAPMKEFVTPHMIGGIRGKPSVQLDIVADHELYMERKIKTDSVENISLDGIVIFIMKTVWHETFGSIPKVNSVIKLDQKDYLVDAVDDDMGMLELTLTGARG